MQSSTDVQDLEDAPGVENETRRREVTAAGGSSRLAQIVHDHREFLLVLVLFTTFRLMAVPVVRAGGLIGDISTFSYYRLLLGFTNQGFLPFVDFWVEYPPIFPWLLLAVYRLSLLIPAWTEPGTWFYILLGETLVLVEAGNLILVYGLSRRLHGQEQAVRLAWIYGALLVPVLTLFTAFDSLPLLFTLWTLLLALDRRPAMAGIAAGLGFMTKLVPFVAVPAALLHLRSWSQRARLLLAAAVTVLLVALPFVLTRPAFLVRALLSPASRSSWETVWALLDGYTSFGVAGGWNRFDPAAAGAEIYASHLPWGLITVAFGLLYLFLLTRRAAWHERRTAVAFAALTQNLLLLYSRGYSPQFLVMVLPFVVLLLPGWRGVLYALLLSAVNLVEYPGYFVLLPGQPWLLAGTVGLRTLLLVVLSLEFAAQVYAWRVPERRWRQVAAGALALAGLLALAGGVAGVSAYAQARYQDSPHRAAMETLSSSASPGALVVVDEQEVYEQVYPYLHRRFELRCVEPADYLPPWEPRLQELATAAGDELWLYTRTDSPLAGWLTARHAPLERQEIDGRTLSRWSPGP